jgi:hypothetical protein
VEWLPKRAAEKDKEEEDKLEDREDDFFHELALEMSLARR